MSILGAVALGAGLHLAGCLHQPSLAAVAATPIATPPFVIVEILAIRIPLGGAVQPLGLVSVPAHEVDGVGKVVAIAPAVAGFPLVVGPGFILDLGIAVGGAGPPGRNEEEILHRRLGIVHEGGLLIHHGHHHLDRGSPLLVHLERRLVPLRLLAKDLAQVFRLGRRPGTTGGQTGQQAGHRNEAHPGHQRDRVSIRWLITRLCHLIRWRLRSLRRYGYE